MIYCTLCHKFAKLKAAWINGADEVKIAGSCKHCGYDERSEWPEGTKFSEIPESKVTYTNFDELGFVNR